MLRCKSVIGGYVCREVYIKVERRRGDSNDSVRREYEEGRGYV